MSAAPNLPPCICDALLCCDRLGPIRNGDPMSSRWPAPHPAGGPQLRLSGPRLGSLRSWPNSDAHGRLAHLEIGGVLEQPTARLYIPPMSEMTRLPKPVAQNWEWQYEGACRSLPTEMFFHPDGERGPRRKAREVAAKAVCASCPVIAQCRAHALAVQEPYGIWGGLTEEERLEIISKAQRVNRAFTA